MIPDVIARGGFSTTSVPLQSLRSVPGEVSFADEMALVDGAPPACCFLVSPPPPIAGLAGAEGAALDGASGPAVTDAGVSGAVVSVRSTSSSPEAPAARWELPSVSDDLRAMYSGPLTVAQLQHADELQLTPGHETASQAPGRSSSSSLSIPSDACPSLSVPAPDPVPSQPAGVPIRASSGQRAVEREMVSAGAEPGSLAYRAGSVVSDDSGDLTWSDGEPRGATVSGGPSMPGIAQPHAWQERSLRSDGLQPVDAVPLNTRLAQLVGDGSVRVESSSAGFTSMEFLSLHLGEVSVDAHGIDQVRERQASYIDAVAQDIVMAEGSFGPMSERTPALDLVSRRAGDSFALLVGQETSSHPAVTAASRPGLLGDSAVSPANDAAMTSVSSMESRELSEAGVKGLEHRSGWPRPSRPRLPLCGPRSLTSSTPHSAMETFSSVDPGRLQGPHGMTLNAKSAFSLQSVKGAGTSAPLSAVGRESGAAFKGAGLSLNILAAGPVPRQMAREQALGSSGATAIEDVMISADEVVSVQSAAGVALRQDGSLPRSDAGRNLETPSFASAGPGTPPPRAPGVAPAPKSRGLEDGWAPRAHDPVPRAPFVGRRPVTREELRGADGIRSFVTGSLTERLTEPSSMFAEVRTGLKTMHPVAGASGDAGRSSSSADGADRPDLFDNNEADPATVDGITREDGASLPSHGAASEALSLLPPPSIHPQAPVRLGEPERVQRVPEPLRVAVDHLRSLLPEGGRLLEVQSHLVRLELVHPAGPVQLEVMVRSGVVDVRAHGVGAAEMAWRVPELAAALHGTGMRLGALDVQPMRRGRDSGSSDRGHADHRRDPDGAVEKPVRKTPIAGHRGAR